MEAEPALELLASAYASVRGKYALRACISSHRTHDGDLDLLCRETVRIGRELQAERRTYPVPRY